MLQRIILIITSMNRFIGFPQHSFKSWQRLHHISVYTYTETSLSNKYFVRCRIYKYNICATSVPWLPHYQFTFIDVLPSILIVPLFATTIVFICCLQFSLPLFEAVCNSLYSFFFREKQRFCCCVRFPLWYQQNFCFFLWDALLWEQQLFFTVWESKQ